MVTNKVANGHWRRQERMPVSSSSGLVQGVAGTSEHHVDAISHLQDSACVCIEP